MRLTSLKYFTFVIAVVAMVVCFVGGASAKDQKPMSKEQIEVIIHDYIMNNPQVFMDSLVQYQSEKIIEKQNLDVTQYNEEIFNAAHSPVAGNPKGDVTVVEFTDYNCGYCKRSASVIAELIKRDKNVRVVFKEYPVLGAASKLASKWAFAAHKQGKYLEFHMALMKLRKPVNKEALNEVASSVGLNMEQLRKDAESEEVASLIALDKKLGKDLVLAGTPVFIIGDTINPGAMPLENIEEEIANQREKIKAKK